MLHPGSKMERPRSPFVGTLGQKYKLWWSGNDAGLERFGILEKVKQLVSTYVPDLSKTFKDGVLKTCDEVCREMKSRRD